MTMQATYAIEKANRYADYLDARADTLEATNEGRLHISDCRTSAAAIRHLINAGHSDLGELTRILEMGD